MMSIYKSQRRFSTVLGVLPHSIETKGDGLELRKFFKSALKRYASPWHDISLKPGMSKELDHFNTVFEITRYLFKRP
jgi:hypothetical protein